MSIGIARSDGKLNLSAYVASRKSHFSDIKRIRFRSDLLAAIARLDSDTTYLTENWINDLHAEIMSVISSLR